MSVFFSSSSCCKSKMTQSKTIIPTAFLELQWSAVVQSGKTRNSKPPKLQFYRVLITILRVLNERKNNIYLKSRTLGKKPKTTQNYNQRNPLKQASKADLVEVLVQYCWN